MIKVLHVIVGLEVGGAELMLSRLVEAHRNSGSYRHEIISLTTLGSIGGRLKAAGVEVTALKMGSLLHTPRVLVQLLLLMKRKKPDIVQTWMYHSDLLGGIAARLAGIKKIMWGIRTTDVGSGNKRSTSAVMAACAQLSRKIPSAIVCAAKASRETHVRAGYDASKMLVVPNGFNVPDLTNAGRKRDEIRTTLGISSDEIVIGTIGRFNPAKDHSNFVLAAGEVAARDPKLRFLLVGRGLTKSNPELMNWIAASGAAERFILLGERADVPACLAAMDIFCLSSRSEGFPNVLGEAMGVGLPCVSTDVGDAAMLLADTGILVPKEDSAELARGMLQLLEMSGAARQKLGLLAQCRVNAEFSIERSREKFEAIYQRLAEKGVC